MLLFCENANSRSALSEFNRKELGKRIIQSTQNNVGEWLMTPFNLYKKTASSGGQSRERYPLMKRSAKAFFMKYDKKQGKIFPQNW